MPSRSASDVVVVDRLEVDLAREHEVAVGEVGQRLERALEREADGVLDEARLQVRVLDDEQLVGPLQQLVDRRAHRRARRSSTRSFGVQLPVGADVEGAAAALVVGGERDEVEDPLDVASSKPASASRSAARPRTSPWAHGQALIPVASTPTTRRDAVLPVAAAIPIERDHLLRREPADRRRAPHRASGAVIRTSARKRALPADDVARDVLGERLDDAAPRRPTTASIASSNSSGKRDMCTPFCSRDEVDRALDLGRHQRLGAPRAGPGSPSARR